MRRVHFYDGLAEIHIGHWVVHQAAQSVWVHCCFNTCGPAVSSKCIDQPGAVFRGRSTRLPKPSSERWPITNTILSRTTRGTEGSDQRKSCFVERHQPSVIGPLILKGTKSRHNIIANEEEPRTLPFNHWNECPQSGRVRKGDLSRTIKFLSARRKVESMQSVTV